MSSKHISLLLHNRINLTIILSWLYLPELALTLQISKDFQFIRSSECLAQSWLFRLLRHYTSTNPSKPKQSSISFLYKMRIFVYTRAFRIFSRIFPYKTHIRHRTPKHYIHHNGRHFDVNKYDWAVNVHDSQYEDMLKYDGSVLGAEAALFKLSTPASTGHSLSLGQKTIVSRQQFLDRFEKTFHFCKWKDAINWRIYNVAGGSIVKCLMALQYQQDLTQDIDLFMSLQTDVFRPQEIQSRLPWCELLNATLSDAFVKKMSSQYEVQCFNSPQVKSVFINFNNTKQCSQNHCLDFMESSESAMLKQFKHNKNYVHIQFIAPFIRYTLSHDLIISNFDMDICQVRFDGKDIYGTFAFIFAMSSMNLISYHISENMIHKDTWPKSICRTIKYANRGFNVLVPHTCNMQDILLKFETAKYQKHQFGSSNLHIPWTLARTCVNLEIAELFMQNHLNIDYESADYESADYAGCCNTDDSDTWRNLEIFFYFRLKSLNRLNEVKSINCVRNVPKSNISVTSQTRVTFMCWP